MLLHMLGAEITGYALEPPTNPSLYKVAKIGRFVNSFIGDIRDKNTLTNVFLEAKPEFVIHLAAQPIVRDGYRMPVYTYETNVLGTVNLLECIRLSSSVRSAINVTTDKVYMNDGIATRYQEKDTLDGFDPYSNSKSCSELVTRCYKRSYFSRQNVLVSTARAGNVIGGGDFAPHRIIPDCFVAAKDRRDIVIRNPSSIRPYQHVLESLTAYLSILQMQTQKNYLEGEYNIGPFDQDCVTTLELVKLFCNAWGEGLGYTQQQESDAPHEAAFLKLDNSKIVNTIGWMPLWDIKTAIEKTVEWYKAYLSNSDIGIIMEQQITEYLKGSVINV